MKANEEAISNFQIHICCQCAGLFDDAGTFFDCDALLRSASSTESMGFSFLRRNLLAVVYINLREISQNTVTGLGSVAMSHTKAAIGRPFCIVRVHSTQFFSKTDQVHFWRGNLWR
ncbi:hypothetical protein ACFONN_07475 [Dyella humi]|uniref:Uncharacterized protein n=1 Tax=Dyella humi TaxID=1770547 RepID=A0ABW8IID7_9GAMM